MRTLLRVLFSFSCGGLSESSDVPVGIPRAVCVCFLFSGQDLGDDFFQLDLHEISVGIGRHQTDKAKVAVFVYIRGHHDDDPFFGVQRDAGALIKAFLAGGFVAE